MLLKIVPKTNRVAAARGLAALVAVWFTPTGALLVEAAAVHLCAA
jgi:hypothetical protein